MKQIVSQKSGRAGIEFTEHENKKGLDYVSSVFLSQWLFIPGCVGKTGRGFFYD
jgi:hypothetical protein